MRKLLVGVLTAAAAFGHADILDETIKQYMETNHVPGASFAIIDPQNKVEYRNYGYSNLELKAAFTEKSVFRIASLSKQFCAYTVLSLIKEGKIGLDDSITQHMPDADPSWAKVKIRHMLNHTSGIPDPGAAFSYSKQYTLAEYLDILGQKPLAEEPGATYRYNNYAYGLLGELVRVITEKDYREVVKERIFDKVGMPTAQYYDPAVIIPNRVDAYRWRNEKLVRPLEDRPKVFDGSGGIMASLEDMVKYELALRSTMTSKQVLDRSVLQQQWTVQIAGAKSGYGFGWHVSDTYVRHTGETFGFTSAFLREKSGWTIILFKNCDGGTAIEWATKLLELRKNPPVSSQIQKLHLNRTELNLRQLAGSCQETVGFAQG